MSKPPCFVCSMCDGAEYDKASFEASVTATVVSIHRVGVSSVVKSLCDRHTAALNMMDDLICHEHGQVEDLH